MRCARSINICEFGRVASTYAEQIDVVRGAPCISITGHHPSCSLRKKQNQGPRGGTSGTAHLYLLTTLLQEPPPPGSSCERTSQIARIATVGSSSHSPARARRTKTLIQGRPSADQPMALASRIRAPERPLGMPLPVCHTSRAYVLPSTARDLFACEQQYQGK